MLTFVALPSRSRCVVTPGRRASDSAIVVSGSLPMSSAEMLSTIVSAFFLTEIALSMAARIPVTTTSSRGPVSAAAGAAGASAAQAVLPGAISKIAESVAVGLTANAGLPADGLVTEIVLDVLI